MLQAVNGVISFFQRVNSVPSDGVNQPGAEILHHSIGSNELSNSSWVLPLAIGLPIGVSVLIGGCIVIVSYYVLIKPSAAADYTNPGAGVIGGGQQPEENESEVLTTDERWKKLTENTALVTAGVSPAGGKGHFNTESVTDDPTQPPTKNVQLIVRTEGSDAYTISGEGGDINKEEGSE